MIPYGRQSISAADLVAVEDVLTSDFLTQGPKVGEFEGAMASRCGAAHAVAANSATSALHLACLALGLKPGDLVLTSPNTFVATANAVRYCGADVEFVDIDPRTYNISASALEARLEEHAQQGRPVQAVIPVHFAGQPCAMAEIGALRSRFGFKVIEDASHAVGAHYGNRPIGACDLSDITVFSFHPVKVMTTGEGGLALTNDRELARTMQLLRSHGVTKDADHLEVADEGPWYYEQQHLGYNYRMTDIQAALGLSQLQRLDSFLDARQSIADRYDCWLASLPLICPYQAAEGRSSWHLYVIRLAEGGASRRRAAFEFMRRNGIGVQVHYVPVYRQPYYRDIDHRASSTPHMERYYESCFSLPMYPDLTEDQQRQVVDTLRRAVET